MFEDKRSKKVIFVSHCILNQNSISDGTADFPGTFEEIVDLLIDSNVGIVQMPCPEFLCLGLDRGDIHGVERDVVVENTRIRDAINEKSANVRMEKLVDQVIFQIEEYINNGFDILGIVGINRSPSCGIETTSKNNREVEGVGVFMKAIINELNKKGIDIEMIGVKTSEVDDSLSKIKELVDKN